MDLQQFPPRAAEPKWGWIHRGAPKSICFGEDVLVLGVTNDETALTTALRSDELETIAGRVDSDERDCGVVILPRSHRTLPAVKAKNRVGALMLYRNTAQSRAGVMSRQHRRFGRARGCGEALPLL